MKKNSAIRSAISENTISLILMVYFDIKVLKTYINFLKNIWAIMPHAINNFFCLRKHINNIKKNILYTRLASYVQIILVR